MTKRYVILSVRRERIRNTLKRGKTDCHSRLHGFAMTKRYVILSAKRERIRNTLKREKTDCRSRLYGFAMTKRYVILNAKRERIRNTLKRKTDCRAPCGASNYKTVFKKTELI